MSQTIPTISKAAYEDALDQISGEDILQFLDEQPLLTEEAKKEDENNFLSSVAVFWFMLKKQMELDAQS
jgi:hypothetical protein